LHTHPELSIDDGYLLRIAAAVPRGSILVIEDIDCAFPSRDANEEDEIEADLLRPQMAASVGVRGMTMAVPGRVTMSGILNLMDGVGSDDGRIIFATVGSGPVPPVRMSSYIVPSDQLLRPP
jgi:mitochondrial chaperone BCS1